MKVDCLAPKHLRTSVLRYCCAFTRVDCLLWPCDTVLLFVIFYSSTDFKITFFFFSGFKELYHVPNGMSPGKLSHGMVYGVVHRTDNNHKREMVVYGWSADQLKEEMNYIKEVSYAFSFKICQISFPYIPVELWVYVGWLMSSPTPESELGTYSKLKTCLISIWVGKKCALYLGTVQSRLKVSVPTDTC